MEPAGQLERLRRLLAETRVGALATVGGGAPYSSLAPFCPAEDSGELLLHLSRMALHTRNLEQEPRASLLLAEADGPDKNPLALVRATFTGTATPLTRGTPEYEAARTRYVARFPESEMMFQLGDFFLFAFRPEAIQLVAGFGQAYRISPAELLSH
ncbi:MAG: CREG family protein [Nitrospirota bacterium]|nr:CREG family protein [Nitrospirota bacterium]